MVYVRLEQEWTDGAGRTHLAGAMVDVDATTLATLEAQGVVAEPDGGGWSGPTDEDSPDGGGWSGPTDDDSPDGGGWSGPTGGGTSSGATS